MSDTNLLRRIFRSKLTYILLAIALVVFLIASAYRKEWKAGRTFTSRDGKITYKMDRQGKDLVLVRSVADPSSGVNQTHVFKIMAYHDAWVELDTTGTGLKVVSATAIRDRLTYNGRFGNSNCDPCLVADTAFEISPAGKK